MGTSTKHCHVEVEKIDLQAQRISSKLAISTCMRSVRCIQNGRSRSIQPEDVKVDGSSSVAWHECIRVMWRIEG